MNKRKLLTLAMTLCMVAILAIGGTLAYFTDTDAAKNVMTTGNVKIKQLEEQRYYDEDGNFYTMGDFEDNKKLAPYTGSVGTNGVANAWGEEANIHGTSYKMFDTANNAIDKIVTVVNVGTEEAYIRTLFAFEMPTGVKYDDFMETQNYLCLTANLGLDNRSLRNTDVEVTIAGVRYAVYAYYYQDDSKLAAGATSHPSLRQFYLNANINNEWYDLVGEEYNILVLSQATQTQGFTSAEEALNTAFGKVDETNATAWFAAVK